MLHKINLSVRVPKVLRNEFRKAIVRLTLNPGLYCRSENLVRWHRESQGRLSAAELVRRARRRYPTLSWSDSVEIYLVDLLEQDVIKRAVLTPEEKKLIRRFLPLSPAQKIQFMQRKIHLYRYLKKLTDESRQRIRSH